MTLLDLLIVIVLAASVVAGSASGFARVGIGLLAVICGVLFGFWFYGVPAAWLHQWLHSETGADLLAFFLIFFAFVSAGALLAKLIAKFFRWTGLSWLDRLMGAMFGLFRGALIVVVLVAVLVAFAPKPLPNWMVNSKTLPYAINASHVMAQAAPAKIKNAFRDSMIEIRQAWVDQVKTMRKELEPGRRPREKDKAKGEKRQRFLEKRESVKRRDLLIFDLDGTLIDSKRDLTDSVNATRAWKDLPPLPDDIVSAYVGNGASMLIRRALPHLTDEEHGEAHKFFLQYYRDHMLDATVLYPGVREALDRLHGESVTMAILTNKPVKFSVRLIAGLNLSDHFFRIYGGNSFDEKKPHPVGIEKLIEESNADREKTFMVGDSAVDVMTARNASVQACGVSWGFQPETFEHAPPDFVIDDLSALADMVLGG